MSNVRLKLTINQVNAKQHTEAELLLFAISFVHPRYLPKIIGHILKNKHKNKYACIHEITRLIIMKIKLKIKNRSHR